MQALSEGTRGSQGAYLPVNCWICPVYLPFPSQSKDFVNENQEKTS